MLEANGAQHELGHAHRDSLDVLVRKPVAADLLEQCLRHLKPVFDIDLDRQPAVFRPLAQETNGRLVRVGDEVLVRKLQPRTTVRKRGMSDTIVDAVHAEMLVELRVLAALTRNARPEAQQDELEYRLRNGEESQPLLCERRDVDLGIHGVLGLDELALEVAAPVAVREGE